ncbi:restriction endonuclease [Chromatium okenii]|uniref:Restriction endonuclease n=2 Tax=Chromatium okenii TaxID=61644 RepID=A0A2S7XMP4_9GAMM|nr:restriction endonuclease [Chromatium okenii]
MSPIQYEQYCAKILNHTGWRARTTVASGDQGADVFAEKNGIIVVIQCKLYYSANVGNKAVQEVYAAKGFYNAHKAFVVSNASYTNSACQLASKLGVFLIHHDDLNRLDSLLVSSAS